MIKNEEIRGRMPAEDRIIDVITKQQLKLCDIDRGA